MERILGLDVGSKTIGVAVSDPLGITAQGVTTIRRTKPEADLKELQGLIDLYNASLLVVGYPRNMNGTVGDQAKFVERFVETLKGRVTLPIELVDERLSTRMANQAMMAGNVKAHRRKEIIDQQAAALILQVYMDRRSRQEKE
jgi:putative Holliday junction resolvase